jgi:hypothetical protein
MNAIVWPVIITDKACLNSVLSLSYITSSQKWQLKEQGVAEPPECTSDHNFNTKKNHSDGTILQSRRSL